VSGGRNKVLQIISNKAGVVQGELLSPTPFAVYVDVVISCLMKCWVDKFSFVDVF